MRANAFPSVGRLIKAPQSSGAVAERLRVDTSEQMTASV